MTPKNKKYLVTETAQRTNIDERRVEAILSFFWRQVRDFMQCPPETAIFINKLGTFKLKVRHVDKYIMDKETFMERFNKKIASGIQPSNGHIEYYKRCENDLIWLNERREDIRRERLIKKQLKERTSEFRKNKAHTTGIQVPDIQEQESRGDSKEEIDSVQE